ncbi:hypothetical protein BH23ACT2_BH23ACT2_00930 [soil metagenome]
MVFASTSSLIAGQLIAYAIAIVAFHGPVRWRSRR